MLLFCIGFSMIEQCPVCGVGVVVKISFPRNLDLGIVKISYEEFTEYCNSCGSVLLSPKTLNQNVKNKNEALEISGVY